LYFYFKTLVKKQKNQYLKLPSPLRRRVGNEVKMKKISQEYRYFVKNNLTPGPSPTRERGA